MYRLVILLTLLISQPSFAFFAKGIYKGQDSEGNPCSFKLGETWYVDEFEHPLTKRVEITQIAFVSTRVKVNHFQAAHPNLLNTDNGRVEINRDVFQDFMATSFGAVAVSLSKAGLLYIEDHFKEEQSKVKRHCFVDHP